MAQSNFERMLQLADEVFSTKSDPNQLDVNEEIITQLLKLHPATVSEYDDGNGPVAWVLLIPTTEELMQKFLENKISEKELFNLTEPGMSFDAVYLCSAMVLDEWRRKGIAQKLILDALEKIGKDHPVKSLFVWTFTRDGDLAAEKISKLTSLPLYKRKNSSRGN